MGRPSNLTTVIGYTEEGDPITVGNRIVNALRAGAYFEQACSAAAVHKETAYGWLRIAGKARIRARGDLDSIDDTLTDHERACLTFSDSVAEAESSWEVGALALLERLARGGIAQVKTVVKVDTKGKVLETTTTTEHSLPSAQVLEWRLERRFPQRYGRRISIEDDRESMSEEEREEAVLDVFDAYLQGVTDEQARAGVELELAPGATKPRRRRRKPSSTG